ncbi:MAG: hypothetical protein EA361_01350 [Bacteroidetes bacterium]|nr:MAG: hypothetical protein EA361_01350 [Bacteroidota bacterium]
MENSNNQYLYEVENNRKSNGSGIIIFLSVLAILLAIAGGLLLREMLKARYETQIANLQVKEINDERNILIRQLDDLDVRYSQLSKEHEDLRQLFEAERRRANQLRAQLQGVGPIGKGDAMPIREQIEQLEEQLATYEDQIAMLLEENETLSIENAQIRSNLAQAHVYNQQLEVETEQLRGKVNIASMINISNVDVVAFRERRRWDEPTTSARRTDKLSICFNMNRNMIAEPGERTFFIRIIDPNNDVLTKSQEDTMPFEGETIQYSIKETVDFQNVSMDVCTEWEQEERFDRGFYSIVVFCEGNEVGYKLFELE